MGNASSWSAGTIAGVAVGVAVVVAGLAVTIWALAKGSSSAASVASPTPTASPAPAPELETDVFTVLVPVTGVSFLGSFMYEVEFLETPSVTQAVTNADMFGASPSDILVQSFASTLTGGTIELRFDNFPLYMPTNLPQVPAGAQNAFGAAQVRGNLWVTYQDPVSRLRLIRNLDGFGITVLEPPVTVATVSGPTTTFLQSFAYATADPSTNRVLASHSAGVLGYSSSDDVTWVNDLTLAVPNLGTVALAQSPVGDGTALLLYADDSTLFAKRSEDDGKTWVDLAIPQPAAVTNAAVALSYVTGDTAYAVLRADAVATTFFYFDGSAWSEVAGTVGTADVVACDAGLAGAFPVAVFGTAAHQVQFRRATNVTASAWQPVVDLPATGASGLTRVFYDNSTGVPYVFATLDSSLVYSSNSSNAADGTWSDWNVLGSSAAATLPGDSFVAASSLGYVGLTKLSATEGALNVLPLQASVEVRAQGLVEA